MYQLCELIHFLGILNHFTPNQIYFLSTKIHQVFIIAICKKYIDAGYETFYHLGGLVIFQTMFVYCGIFYRSVVPIVVLDEVFYCLLHIIRQSPLADSYIPISLCLKSAGSSSSKWLITYLIFLMVFGLLPQSIFSLIVISSFSVLASIRHR